MKITSEDLKNQVPRKKCGKCGNVIPLNGEHGVDGKLLKTPRLACEWCARAAAPALPPRKRPLRNGEKHDEQENFLKDIEAIEVRPDGR